MKTKTATTAIGFLKGHGGKIGQLAQGIFEPGVYRPIGERLNEIEELLTHEQGASEKMAAAELIRCEIGLLKFLIHPPPDEYGCVVENGPEEVAYHAVRLGAELMRFAMDYPGSEIVGFLKEIRAEQTATVNRMSELATRKEIPNVVAVGIQKAARKNNKKLGPLGRRPTHDATRMKAAMLAMHRLVRADNGMKQADAAEKVWSDMKLGGSPKTLRRKYPTWLHNYHKKKKT